MKQNTKLKKLHEGISLLYTATVAVVTILAMCMIIYTIFMLRRGDRQEPGILGYSMFIVLSDSMSATDFDAGDLIIIRQTDVAQLQEGDIIVFISGAEENYGEKVAHKIRKCITDATGNFNFLTYGTSTGEDDRYIVKEQDILGKYQFRIPAIGRLLAFIKTGIGFFLLILLPLLILAVFQGGKCWTSFRDYRRANNTDEKCSDGEHNV